VGQLRRPGPSVVSDDQELGKDREASDAELIARVRAGEVDAYADLWSRHFAAVRGVARRIAPADDVDDLISESYTRVLSALRAGQGPDTAFRAYLASTVRRVNIDQARRYGRRIVLTEREETLERDTAESSEDIAVKRSMHDAAWDAWLSLPEDTRELLWNLVVREETPARLAHGLGLTPNAVASRGRRARERLRQAYLSVLVAGTTDPECEQARRELGPYIRKSLGQAPRDRVDDHLETCAKCRAAVSELLSIDATIRSRIAPFVPVGAVAAITHRPVAASVSAGTTGAPTVGKLSVVHLPSGLAPIGLAVSAGALSLVAVLLALTAGSDNGHPAVTRPAQAHRSAAPSHPEPTSGRVLDPATSTATSMPMPASMAVSSPQGSSRTVSATRAGGAGPTAPEPSSVPARVLPASPVALVPSAARRTAAPVISTPAHTTPVPETPARTTPAGVVTTVSLDPETSRRYLLHLHVSQGWRITSVRDAHDGARIQSLVGPARTFVELFMPGPVEVEVMRLDGAPGAGQLTVHLVAREGPLDGSGTYPLQ